MSILRIGLNYTLVLWRRWVRKQELEALSQRLPDLGQENALLKLRRRIAF